MDRFEKLPVDRQFLAKMPVSEIFDAIRVLTPDKFRIWEELDKTFKQPRCMENVVMHQYKHFFNENSDANWKERFAAIETEV